MSRFGPMVFALLAASAVAGTSLAFPAPKSREGEAFARSRSTASVEERLAPRRSARLPARPGPTGSRSARAPVDEGGFLGITGDGTTSPSDTTGAVGTALAVTAVNVRYAVWPKSTLAVPPAAPAPIVEGTLISLFPNLPGGTVVFDPKVVYDPHWGRFVLVFLGAHGPPFGSGVQRSWILVASTPESTAADPSSWCRKAIPADQVRGDGAQLADYPGLGFDRDRVYVTTNQFSFGQRRFEYAQILGLAKSPLYTCRGKLKRAVFAGRQTLQPEGGPAFTIQPAVTQSPPGVRVPQYLVSFNDRSCGSNCGNRLTIWRAARGRHELRLVKHATPVPLVTLAPFGTQRDGSPLCIPVDHCWDTGDLRLTTAFYDAERDRLYAAHAIRTDVSPGDGYIESAVAWYEIDPSPISQPVVTRRGILAESGLDSGWGAVATDAAGNLVIGFSRAGAVGTEYLSAMVATIPPGSDVPDAVETVVPGEALYLADAGRFQRWGDFAAANRDPVDPFDVWVINQYSRTDGLPPTNIWQQIVNRISFG